MIAYFGVLDPTKFTPESCTTTSGFSCVGTASWTMEDVSIDLMNALGTPVTFDASKARLPAGCTEVSFSPKNNPNFVSVLTVADQEEFTMKAKCTTPGVAFQATLGYTNPQVNLDEQMTVMASGLKN